MSRRPRHGQPIASRLAGNVITTLMLLLGLAGAVDSTATPTNAAPLDVKAPPADAVKLPSGVAARVMKAGEGTAHPAAGDCVAVHVMTWRRDGSFVGGTRHFGDPASFCLVNLPSGLSEAIKAMVVGEQRRLWLPASLMFPPVEDEAAQVKVKAVATTADVELLGVAPAPAPPASLKRPPAEVTKTPSGLSIEWLKHGQGTHQPTDASSVRLAVAGWTLGGRVIESTVGRPALVAVSSVMPGWREALWQMVVGDKVRLWIPEALAHGPKAKSGKASGAVVYEVELQEIR